MSLCVLPDGFWNLICRMTVHGPFMAPSTLSPSFSLQHICWEHLLEKADVQGMKEERCVLLGVCHAGHELRCSLVEAARSHQQHEDCAVMYGSQLASGLMAPVTAA